MDIYIGTKVFDSPAHMLNGPVLYTYTYYFLSSADFDSVRLGNPE